jgi:hypothetical protein
LTEIYYRKKKIQVGVRVIERLRKEPIMLKCEIELLFLKKIISKKHYKEGTGSKRRFTKQSLEIRTIKTWIFLF